MGFSIEQHGLYIMTLIYQFNNGKFTLDQIKNAIGEGFEKIKQKFKTDGKLYWNERLDYEKEKRQLYVKSRRDSIDKRWCKNDKPLSGKKIDNIHTYLPSQIRMENENEDENTLNSSLKDARKLSSYSTDFESFWKEYPRRKDKGHAYKQWLVEIKMTEPAAIVAGATRYAVECSGKDEKYIKFAQGWLSGQRWLDEKGPGRFDHITDPVRREIMEKYAE